MGEKKEKNVFEKVRRCGRRRCLADSKKQEEKGIETVLW
jgi:hypothetical protein